ncbi:ATP-binding protein [Anabaena sp. FACHB-709]|uniref:Sigma-B activity negative regulator n=2 Tax=Nostocaceae TaxID=1162 RepID=A0A1Z4KG22_ANAVA|nr:MULTISPECIES: anti-sigma regulatory factor [Nostocaceae]BAY67909.1 sigma-B activity negative regulator [Trichormus variabilis NIES-23]HBW29657.1 anti-sigma regulatory factor [Nostoc sp. UBA8866]MBD2170001.1 anti-sigma regulatory factor [Anabaena cylindrica FACHB-318]MBD2261579.1 anti-sigma regulatory factor [Anabaena sp. FACHB-709]MBD2271163.1 anti-sigma regulatory factor [Nostoc sp. PCC 7120 = FACHB-418]
MSPHTDSQTHHSTLQVASDWDAVATVVEWFEKFNCKQLPYQIWIEGQTALIEGFTNAVRHAHKHLNPQTPVELAVTLDPQYFQICIWDQGDIFNFEAALEKLSEKTNDQAFNPLDHEAHWGCIFFLKLRRDYAWTVSYNRELAGRNCLFLKKNLVPKVELPNARD